MIQVKKGPDVSEHQGIIDWDKAKADGIDFAMIRCGFGSDQASQDDKQFERNVAECERLGIPWGAYLYSYALNREDAQSEVAHVRRLLTGKHPTYPVAFDMEDADGYKAKHGMPSNETLVDICYDFLLALESDGHYAVLYASLSWLNNQLDNPKLDRFDKWVAQWGPQCTYGKTYGLWQFTNSGAVNGMNGRIDMNYCYRDFGLNIQPAQQPAPAAQPSPVQHQVNNDVFLHVVQLGETLSGIAAKYGLSVEYIAKLNGIDNPNMIYAGQRLKLKGNVSAGIPVAGYIKIKGTRTGKAIICDRPSSSNSRNLDTISEGSTIAIAGSIPGWWEVIWNEQRAYINAKYAVRV